MAYANLRQHRKYQREWQRAKRARSMAFCLAQAERALHYWKKHREERLAAAREYKRENRDALKAKRRAYRRDELGFACHFCGNSGRKKHPLRRLRRTVLIGDYAIECTVHICWLCRGEGPKNRNGGRPKGSRRRGQQGGTQ